MQAIPGPPYAGYYQHFRGDVYFVHKMVVDQTNERHGRIMVLYERLNDYQIMVRDVREFIEHVHPEDGTPSFMVHMNSEIKDCKLCVPRFYAMSPAEISSYNKHLARKPRGPSDL